MPRELERVRRAAENARRAHKAAAEARRQRDAAIMAAYVAGAAVREIAEAAGMSYQRVAQIVRDAL